MIRPALFILLALPCGAAAQMAEIKEIDAYVKGIQSLKSKSTTPKLVFADTADHNKTRKSDWRRFATEKALENHRARSETYTIAYAWRRGGRVIATSFTFFSPSGDWAKYVYSYFRDDGTLAKVDIDYRTFHGDLIVLQELYFNRAGDPIKRATAYRDLNTNKPTTPDKGYLEENLSLLNELDHYTTTSKLPFTHLLRRAKKS